MAVAVIIKAANAIGRRTAPSSDHLSGDIFPVFLAVVLFAVGVEGENALLLVPGASGVGECNDDNVIVVFLVSLFHAFHSFSVRFTN